MLQRNNGCARDPLDTRECQECLIEIARVPPVPAFIAGDVNENISCMISEDELQAVAKARASQFVGSGAHI
jgi:hypothetical protein